MAVKSVYADCAASCPVHPVAMEAFIRAAGTMFEPSVMPIQYANPNSVHTLGRESRKALEQARETVARCINAKPDQIAFTPSATSACRTALDLFDYRHPFTTYDCSLYEHKAVWGYLSDETDDDPVDGCYAHMLANNETGERYDTIVRDLAKDNVVFCDATAAVGQIPVDVQWLGVHALAAGAHKFGGFPGIGFLYLKDGITDEATFPGTPPVALAVAMANALAYRTAHMTEANTYLMEQTERLAKAILDIPGAHINTPMDRRLPNILSVRLDGVNARELLTMLDVNGVYASAGSACTADSDEPSRVLLASGLTEEQALSTIRLSFCPETTPAEFRRTAGALRRCVTQLRSLNK